MSTGGVEEKGEEKTNANSNPSTPVVVGETSASVQATVSLGRSKKLLGFQLASNPGKAEKPTYNTAKKPESTSENTSPTKATPHPPIKSSLAGKISKSFLDLASNERLRNWKAKLSNGGGGNEARTRSKSRDEHRRYPPPVVPIAKPSAPKTDEVGPNDSTNSSTRMFNGFRAHLSAPGSPQPLSARRNSGQLRSAFGSSHQAVIVGGRETAAAPASGGCGTTSQPTYGSDLESTASISSSVASNNHLRNSDEMQDAGGRGGGGRFVGATTRQHASLSPGKNALTKMTKEQQPKKDSSSSSSAFSSNSYNGHHRQRMTTQPPPPAAYQRRSFGELNAIGAFDNFSTASNHSAVYLDATTPGDSGMEHRTRRYPAQSHTATGPQGVQTAPPNNGWYQQPKMTGHQRQRSAGFNYEEVDYYANTSVQPSVSSSILPPPARIYAGQATQIPDIVKPIAFRPMMTSSKTSIVSEDDNNNNGGSNLLQQLQHRHSSNGAAFNSIATTRDTGDSRSETNSLGYGTYGHSQPARHQRAGSDYTAAPLKTMVGFDVGFDHAAYTPRHMSDSEVTAMTLMGRPVEPPPYHAHIGTAGGAAPAAQHRPRPIYHTSTSTSLPENNYVFSEAPPHPGITGVGKAELQKIKDDDYDIVPEFVDLLKQQLVSDDRPLAHQQQQQQQQQQSVTRQQQMQNYAANISSRIQQRNEVIERLQHNGGSTSRQSSGIHVTPSPSDSGVAEVEAMLRDKDSELNRLRSAMEQNEEIIVRVYQEKENRWQHKLKEWSSRLELAVQNERKLLEEIHRLRDDRNLMQGSFKDINAEKQGLQRKCKELEREMFDMRDRMTNNETTSSICSKCQAAGSSPIARRKSSEGPVAPPRPSKGAGRSTAESQERPKSPTPQYELRGEIDLLRNEVLNLKESLTDEIRSFTEERKRWENEKAKILQYQKLLQASYVQLSQRNVDMEKQLRRQQRTSANGVTSAVTVTNRRHTAGSEDSDEADSGD